MKHLKKVSAILLAVMMMLAVSVTAFAQDVDTEQAGQATITISNAAKGETYSVYKLFDATVTGTEDGSIAYIGTIPDSLKTYFEEIGSTGYVKETEAARDGDNMSAGLKAALKTWAAGETAVKDAISDGSTLNFTNLGYGYYVVTTTQGEQGITVTSTNPNATIVDKNSTTPTGLTKSVDEDNVKIGDTVTYTVKFKTANFDGAGEGAKQIVSYTIEDTLPEFLSNVTVTGIAVDNDGDIATTNDQTALTVQQFDSKKITIPWVDGDTSLYKNGTYVVITYNAVVTDKAAIDGQGNTNTVKMTWKDKGDDSDHGKDEASTTIYTYALALKKVSDTGANLAGAKFQFPFYVKETADADGAYIYAGTTAGDGLVNEITTPDNGEITIKGLKSGEAVSITEKEAPDGYNKLTAAVSVKPVKTGETTTTKTWKIKDGEVVEDSVTENVTTVEYNNDKLAATPIIVINKTGTTLPSTGGMGTTLFTIIGSALMAGAVVVLVAKRKMA